MKKLFFLSVLVMVIVTVVVILVAVGGMNNRFERDQIRAIQLGESVVFALYEYKSLEEFDTNIDVFEGLVTDEVFRRMTANNTDRVLSVYLKFRSLPVLVNIIESTPSYVVYSLVSEAIEPERLFVLVFEVTEGKISAIREAELFPFVTTVGWDLGELPEFPEPFSGFVGIEGLP